MQIDYSDFVLLNSYVIVMVSKVTQIHHTFVMKAWVVVTECVVMDFFTLFLHHSESQIRLIHNQSF